MASYAMAHLNINMLLKQTGATTVASPKDGNFGDLGQRLRIYLTNSLDEAQPLTKVMFVEWLMSEAIEARRIKQNAPVMVVLGNPPYSGESQNQSKWINHLLDDYKKEPSGKKLQEKNSKWINDDYVKFIRYGQFFIDKNGEGILGKDVRDWSVSGAKRDLTSNPDFNKTVEINYRPFDKRFTYYTGKSNEFHCMPKNNVMQNFLKRNNVGLVFRRQQPESRNLYIFCSNNIMADGYIRSDNKGGETVAPLYDNVEKFWTLVKFGEKLRRLHLLEGVEPHNIMAAFPIADSNEIEKLDYITGKIYINNTQYFDQVPTEAWDFYIGGYQPAQKWLKDRKGRKLNYDDIRHYQRIIESLYSTSQIMNDIALNKRIW